MKNQLKELRIDAGWSMSTLAKKSGISRVTICKIEHGHCIPNPVTIKKLSEPLRCQPNDIFMRD